MGTGWVGALGQNFRPCDHRHQYRRHHPISPGFSGVSTDLALPGEYWDYRFNARAAAIGFGWVRFPGGTSSDIYDWQTAEDDAAWQAEFPASVGLVGVWQGGKPSFTLAARLASANQVTSVTRS